jgi:hypothetical protein
MNIIKIDNYNAFPDFPGSAPDTIEWHIKNAYNKTFFFFRSEIPEFFDIYDLFMDDIADTGRKFFVSEIYGLPMSIGEIGMELIQDALVKMNMELKNIEGEHVCSCQNILFENWEGED